ncbi:Glycosyltransferase 2-like [uncultured Caudovirales phage]|uniref:Glycosyltransferase 2-like n=1 Tax=uncultured Caudovirales phage TaxID=2100421 RepID=A0A6J5M9G7_9CAUD|nr:Glycosyltransferase 2-like [uncultured Caudovirales phage]
MIDPLMSPQGVRPRPWIPLSVVTIAHRKDAHWLESMIKTLPQGCELVVLWNEHGDDDTVRERKEKALDNGVIVRFFETNWKEFSFSEIRNKAIAKAERDWILWLDADDRLMIHQHPMFLKLDEYPAGVAGLLCGCVGVQPTHSTEKPNEVVRYHVEQVRIFRNGHGFQFENRAHEQITYSIQRAGYNVGVCSLLVHHEGYQVDADTMRSKMERNVRLLAADVAECTDETKFPFLVDMLNRDTQGLKFYSLL